jgi:hypothetical protein
MKNRLVLLAVASLGIAACDSTDPGGPGTITASVISPNGAEGAAILDVTGVVDTVTSGGDLRAFSTVTPTGRRVIVVRSNPGALSVRLRVPDVSQPPSVSIVEVADGDDSLRSSLAGYRVELN